MSLSCRSGEAAALKTEAGGKVIELPPRFNESDFFGEMALLNSEPRICSVTAMSDEAVVYELDKEPFQRILGSLEDIIKRADAKNLKHEGGDGVDEADSSLRDIPKSELKEVSR